MKIGMQLNNKRNENVLQYISISSLVTDSDRISLSAGRHRAVLRARATTIHDKFNRGE